MYRKFFLYAFALAIILSPFSLVQASVPSYTLSVVTSGNGRVTSNPAGINCDSNRECPASYPSGTSVTLTASPAGGWEFWMWSGSCENTTGNCVVVMNGNKDVQANFRLIPVNQGGGSGQTIINNGTTGGTVVGGQTPTGGQQPTQPPAGGTTPGAGTQTPGTTAPPAGGTTPGTGTAGQTAPPTGGQQLSQQTAGGQPVVTGPVPSTGVILSQPPAAVNTGNLQLSPAITNTEFAGGLVPCDGSPDHPCDFNAFMALINKVIRFILFSLAIPIAAIMFAYAGFLMVTSGGSTEARGRAKKIFTNAVYGLVIAAGAWLIIRTILSILGYEGAWIGFPLVV